MKKKAINEDVPFNARYLKAPWRFYAYDRNVGRLTVTHKTRLEWTTRTMIVPEMLRVLIKAEYRAGYNEAKHEVGNTIRRLI